MKKKFWLCLYLSVALNPTFFFRCYSLFHQDAPCNLSSIPFLLGLASITMFSMHFITLQKMSEKDRYCCLLFDEMSIRENVWFNQKFDCIEGYEDLGSQGRTCNFANHALLFMVRGLHRKWNSRWLTTSVVEVLRLRSLSNSWWRFLKHVRMLDCMLLPLSVTWVPTTSRP